jgi:hypothetical protein
METVILASTMWNIAMAVLVAHDIRREAGSFEERIVEMARAVWKEVIREAQTTDPSVYGSSTSTPHF